jgi:hypothetical protein
VTEPTRCYRGIIPPDQAWIDSVVASKWTTFPTDKGWGKRYPVRIIGVHSEDKAVLSDTQLPWLEVSYPVTAGTGHGAAYQTSNLRAGSIVMVTQMSDNQYYITGCFGNNEQTPLTRDAADNTSGFSGISGFPSEINSVPVFALNIKGDFAIESATNAQQFKSFADNIQFKDGYLSAYLSASTTCEKVELGGILLKIKNFIKEITTAKLWLAQQKASLEKPIDILSSGVSTEPLSSAILIGQSSGISTGGSYTDAFVNAVSNSNSFPEEIGIIPKDKEDLKFYDISSFISEKINNVSKDVAAFLKTLLASIEQYTRNKINDSLKQVYYSIFPNDLEKVKSKIETANDLLGCLFRKIVKNLIKMCSSFLSSAADYLINTPLCAVENFVGGLIGKIVGLISGAIDAILSPVKAILGVFDLAQDILGFVENVLSSLSCDENPTCPEIKEWSVWDGPQNVVSADITSLINRMNSFATIAQGSIDPDNFDFDLDFSDVFTDSCNVGAIFCGPPNVEFFGGGGFGAAGNAIINNVGEIIGVDITNSGRGYTSSPFVKFRDACGNGSGAVAFARIGTISIPSPTILIGIQDTGTGGGTGTGTGGGGTGTGTGTGGGETGTGITDIIIEDPGGGYLPSPDGSQGGDGRTLTSPTNRPRGFYPYSSNGQYPVIMKLCEIVIDKSGAGYSANDTIVIEPANGATAKVSFNSSGSVSKIDVLTKGEGFTELPVIYIKSVTGFGAQLLPRLCAERIGTDLTNASPNLQKIINVVDCPGR